MTKNLIDKLQTILVDRDVEANDRLADEMKGGLLFVICTLVLMFTGVVLILHGHV
jgi:hypothetical protein